MKMSKLLRVLVELVTNSYPQKLSTGGTKVQTRPRFTLLLDRVSTMTRQSPSGAHPEPLRRRVRGVLACIGIALCIMPEAGGSKPKQYVTYKEYALHLLNYDYKQMKCLGKLYGKESAWNPKARNGSHYGIPQGRSVWLRDQDGYAQVRWGLGYIEHRYSTPCKAYEHWKLKNWH
jgi:hypothetical protein